MLANKRVLELHQDLRKLLEWLVGGKRERGSDFTGGGGDGAGAARVARGGEQREGLNRRLSSG
jgi:hypothetical protein